jgi:hypothetical protein
VNKRIKETIFRLFKNFVSGILLVAITTKTNPKNAANKKIFFITNKAIMYKKIEINFVRGSSR